MRGKFWRKALAAALALLIVSGSVPIQPFSRVLDDIAITAHAEYGNLSDLAAKYPDSYISVEGQIYVDRDITLSKNQSLVLQDDTELYVEEGCTLTLNNMRIFVSSPNLKSKHNLTIRGGGTITGKTAAGMSHINNLIIDIGKYDFSRCGTHAIYANSITINGGSIVTRGLKQMVAAEDINLNGGVIDCANCYAGGHIYVKGVEVDASYVTNGVLVILRKCTVTWKNYDGTVLKTDTVEYGKTPSYSGTPTKAGDAQYSYTFSGWSPAVSAVKSDTIYTAQYRRTTNSYTVTWKNDDGSTLKTDTVEYGKTPSYSGTPTKAADAQYIYTFSGWSPAITSVTGNQTYTAQYSRTVNKYKYTVTWKNGDTTLETDTNVPYSTTPTYNGATPTKANDDKYSYTFKDWSPSVSSVSGDVTYTAQFTKEPLAAHFSQNGDTYTIHDETGWEIFCDCLQDNDTYNRFSGKTVKLDADITVTRMAGSSQHDFCGTFDGQGHTLTFNHGRSDKYSADEYIAPFLYVSTVTPEGGSEIPVAIKNLHINGDIYTSAKYAAGLISRQWGTVNIENCRSSIIIHSNVTNTNNDGTHGGFTAIQNNGTLNITGCVFDGKILTNAENITNNCGGFVGWSSSGTTNITNSIYAPATIGTGETEVASGATFVRNASAGTNCYYTRSLGDAQGKQAHTITAGESVTIDYGTATEIYDVSGITAYGTGLAYNNNFYAGNGDEVALTLGHSNTTPTGYTTAYTASAGELSGNTLTMPNEDVTVSAEFTFSDGTGACLEGCSLSVQDDGDIGVNFYMLLDDSIVNNANAKMRFVIPINSKNNETKTLDMDIPTPTTLGSKTYYVFKCPVAAKEMTAAITARVYVGDEAKGDPYTYTVRDYAEYLINHAEGKEAYTKALPLVKAMLHYGASAQTLFNNIPGDLANKNIEAAAYDDPTQAIKDMIDGTTLTNLNETSVGENLTFDGASLNLGSKTAYTLYYAKGENYSGEAPTITCEGHDVDVVENANEIRYIIRNISAGDLLKNITVTIGITELTVNPATYFYAALTAQNTNEYDYDNLKKAVTALYYFNEAAKNYKGVQ